MSDDDDLAALREQTPKRTRVDESPDDIAAELEAIDAGEQKKTISIWDGPMAAFVRALEENPDQMDEIGHALQEALDADESDVDRSEVLRLAPSNPPLTAPPPQGTE